MPLPLSEYPDRPSLMPPRPCAKMAGREGPSLATLAKPRVDISTSYSLPSGSGFRRLLRQAARAALHVAQMPGTGQSLSVAGRVGPSFPDEGRRLQVGLVVAEDDTLRRLNRDYRGVDEVTDVLAFCGTHPGRWLGDEPRPSDEEGEGESATFVMPPQGPLPLGEVVISYPQAQRQARQQGHSTEREMALLVVHGVLHLIGYDHAEPGDEAVMKAKEMEALGRVFRREPG